MCGGKGGPRTGCCSFAVGLSDSSSAAPTPPTHARTGQLVSSSACAGAGAGAGAGGAGSTGAAPASDIIIVRNVVEWRDLWIYQSPSPLLVSFSPSLVFVLRTYGQFTKARATSHMHSHMHWRHALETWRCLLPALSLTIQQRTVCLDGWVLICLSRALIR